MCSVMPFFAFSFVLVTYYALRTTIDYILLRFLTYTIKVTVLQFVA